jgi:hypothetical protein
MLSSTVPCFVTGSNVILVLTAERQGSGIGIAGLMTHVLI